MLKPAFEYGKPVVITKFGVQTYQGAFVLGFVSQIHPYDENPK